MISIRTYSKELKFSRTVALKAGRYLLSARKKRNQIVKQPHGEGYMDVTTKADLEAEKMIIGSLSREFPQDTILSEETLADELSNYGGRIWIVDPLDGTTNYVKGLDAFGVSISLMVDGKIVLAVSYIPAGKEMFHAVRGSGVFRNGKILRLTTPEDTLAKSLVSVGFPHSRDKSSADPAFEMYRDLWLAASDLRRSASAVFDGCLLASGITGAYLTPDIKPWDVAAASLFIEEQGGVVGDFNGGPLDLFRRRSGRFCVQVVFSKNKSIHSALQAITRKYNQHQS